MNGVVEEARENREGKIKIRGSEGRDTKVRKWEEWNYGCGGLIWVEMYWRGRLELRKTTKKDQS